MPLARILGLLVLTTLGACMPQSTLPDADMRYRGDYTLGHEVNAFCPAGSSRCYWLDPNAAPEVRDALALAAKAGGDAPYPKVCVVVAGEVDTESARDGFAADYDGLIDVQTVYGFCEDVSLVTQGDLAHRRWVAAAPAVGRTGLTPTLDFGQRVGRGVFVEGNDGCQEFTAVLLLRNALIEFSALEWGASQCSQAQGKPAFNPREPAVLELGAENRLQLTTSIGVVLFDLRDWVQ